MTATYSFSPFCETELLNFMFKSFLNTFRPNLKKIQLVTRNIILLGLIKDLKEKWLIQEKYYD